jgi:hypothetical protein
VLVGAGSTLAYNVKTINHNRKQSWLCGDIDQQNILLITIVDHPFAWYLKSFAKTMR